MHATATATWFRLEPLDVDHTLTLAYHELRIGSDTNLWLSTEAASFITRFKNFLRRSLLAPVSDPENVTTPRHLI